MGGTPDGVLVPFPPSARTGRGGGNPPWYRTTDGVLDTPQSVCLLCSRKRTFLFKILFLFVNKCWQLDIILLYIFYSILLAFEAMKQNLNYQNIEPYMFFLTFITLFTTICISYWDPLTLASLGQKSETRRAWNIIFMQSEVRLEFFLKIIKLRALKLIV